MLGNFGGIISQVQNLQASLKGITVEISVGEGAVSVAMDGSQHLLGVKIAPEVINTEDIARLEDLVTEGLSKVQTETRNRIQQEISKLTGINVANLPNLFQG
ncbi:YbaB/EbfC family nucleoid-associated protein [Desulforamulus ruminis]|uniref:Uncharacterized protein family UPF0133 n=1 Tax=Desulforamulus ruminis (strain ATCC 23193 / DSM 2154 / NCIMB 8452 / DL) TaxID=696281 RepID=F6DMP6_DESRL|nr:Uncharacterized protein family UPF0133 [Desulforamulus ruminis DSM 2154]